MTHVKLDPLELTSIDKATMEFYDLLRNYMVLGFGIEAKYLERTRRSKVVEEKTMEEMIFDLVVVTGYNLSFARSLRRLYVVTASDATKTSHDENPFSHSETDAVLIVALRRVWQMLCG